MCADEVNDEDEGQVSRTKDPRSLELVVDLTKLSFVFVLIRRLQGFVDLSLQGESLVVLWCLA